MNKVDFIGNIPFTWLNIGMLCNVSANALGLKEQNFVLRFMGFTGNLNLMTSYQLGFIMDETC